MDIGSSVSSFWLWKMGLCCCQWIVRTRRSFARFKTTWATVRKIRDPHVGSSSFSLFSEGSRTIFQDPWDCEDLRGIRISNYVGSSGGSLDVNQDKGWGIRCRKAGNVRNKETFSAIRLCDYFFSNSNVELQCDVSVFTVVLSISEQLIIKK